MKRILAAGAVALAGCSAAPTPTPDPIPNSPIRVIGQSPQQVRTTFRHTTLCPAENPAFTLTVEDPDVADQVHSLWFIGSTNTQPFSPSPLASGVSERRVVTSPVSVSFKSTLANLPQGTEVLTVFVADTPFLEVVGGTVDVSSRPATALADGGLRVDQGFLDSFTWTLDVEACP